MANLPIVRSNEEAQAHDTNQPALVLVPGDLVKSVVWLMSMIQKPDDDEIGKTVKTLLRKRGKRG